MCWLDACIDTPSKQEVSSGRFFLEIDYVHDLPALGIAAHVGLGLTPASRGVGGPGFAGTVVASPAVVRVAEAGDLPDEGITAEHGNVARREMLEHLEGVNTTPRNLPGPLGLVDDGRINKRSWKLGQYVHASPGCV
jgi:hypothetical protein